MALTKFVLGTRFELLVCHEFLDAPREGGDMIDDQLVQVGELVLPVDDQGTTSTLARGIGVRLIDVYTPRQMRILRGNANDIPMC